MTDIFNYIQTSVLMCILFITPAILFDAWLVKTGRIQHANRAMILIAAIIFVFIKPLLRGNVSWWAYGIIYILGILAMNRSDLGETIKNGPWWWLSKKDKKKYSDHT